MDARRRKKEEGNTKGNMKEDNRGGGIYRKGQKEMFFIGRGAMCHIGSIATMMNDEYTVF